MMKELRFFISALLLCSYMGLYGQNCGVGGTGKTPVSVSSGLTALRNQFEDGTGPSGGSVQADYKYYSPVGTNDNCKYPLFVWLHGAGQGASPGAQILGNEIAKWSSSEYQQRVRGSNGMFILVPRMTLLWTPGNTQAIVESFVAAHSENIDMDRIYIGGFSMGGMGTWEVLESYYEYYAAALPICPALAPTPSQLAAMIDLPVWLTCSSLDLLWPMASSNWEDMKYNMNRSRIRLSTLGVVLEPDGSPAESNHHSWFAVTNDGFTNSNAQYYNMVVTDGYETVINLTYPNGYIDWLTQWTISGRIDVDGDGYASDIDCNDNNADVYPGATEVCNGTDDDCDGSIDEDCTTPCDPFSVNVQIEAEDYCEMSGVQIETTTDIGGGQNVGWIETGDYMTYYVSVPSAGTYSVDYRIASQSGGGSISLEANGSPVGTISVPSTGAWQTWQTISHNVSLPADTVEISIVAASGGFNINWLLIEGPITDADGDGYTSDIDCNDNNADVNPGATEVCNGIDDDCDGSIDEDCCDPFSVNVQIEAEDYCEMSGVQIETTTDIGGGQNVGWIETGDYMTYYVSVPSAGTYSVDYRIASQSGGGSISLEANGSPVGTISVPSTGAWQTWQTISHNVSLPADTVEISIVAASGGFNINWLLIEGPNTLKSSENFNYSGLKSTESQPINSFAFDERIEVYPVPADEQLIVKADSAYKVSLCDLSGRIVASKFVTESEVIFNVNNLPKGVYLVVIINKTNTTEVRKVVIQ